MREIKELEDEYMALLRQTSLLTKKITEHFHAVFDEKLLQYKDFNEFLEDVNHYAGDTLGKLLYINYAKTKLK